MVQRLEEEEFMKLKMNGYMIMMQYASKFTKLSKFIPEFVLSERLKMRGFEEIWPSTFDIS